MKIEEFIRNVRIHATAEGVPQTEAALKGLGQAYDKVGQSAAASAQVTDTSAKKQISMADSVERMQRRYDSVYRAQREFEKVQRQLNIAVQQNPELQERANRVLGLAQQRYQDVVAATRQARGAFEDQAKSADAATGSINKYAGASGLARHEVVNMSRQIQDVAVSLGSGQSPMTVLLQQGTQIADIIGTSQGTVRGFLGQVGAWAGRVFTATRLAVGGVTAVGVAGIVAISNFSDGQREVEKSLLGIGRASGATRKDINRIAEESSSMFGLSISEAREFASALAATGQIGVSQLGEITKLGKEVAQVFGIDATEAAKKLAEAYADPVKGAEELNKRLGSFDAATMRNIKNLVEQNRIMEAQQVITAAIRTGVEGVGATVSKTSKFWTGMGNDISMIWEKIGEGLSRVTGLGPNLGIEDQIAAAEKRLTSLQQQFSSLPKWSQSGAWGQQVFDKIKETTAELAGLHGQLRDVGVKSEEAARRLSSIREAALVTGQLPLVGQLETALNRAQALLDLYAKLNAMGGDPSKAPPGQEHSRNQAGLAHRAAEQTVLALKDQVAMSERLVVVNEELRQKYPEMSLEIAKQVEGLQNQLGLAQAVGGAARMAAQEEATYLSLKQAGVKPEEAARVAAEQRAVAQAQANSQALEGLFALQNQAEAAAAVGAGARIAAEGQATYNRLVRDGVDASIAMATANAQTANALAQVEAQAQGALAGLRDQHEVSAAITGVERMRAQENAKINQLIRDGVSATQAAAIAAQERNNAEAQVSSSIQQQIKGLEQQAEMIAARRDGTEAATSAAHAYENAIAAGASETDAAALSAAQMNLEMERAESSATRIEAPIQRGASALELAAAEAQKLEAALYAAVLAADSFKVGDSPDLGSFRTGNNKAGTGGNFTFDTRMLPGGGSQYSSYDGGAFGSMNKNYTWEQGGFGGGGMVINATGIENTISNMLKEGLPLDMMVSEILKTARGVPGDDQWAAINRLLDLSPDGPEKINQLESQLAIIRQQPISLAREELIQSLNSKIEQLRKSTEENTAATIGLSDLYSAGHSGKIGFYQEGERTRLIDPSNPMSLPPSMMTNAIMLPTTSTQAIPSTTVNGKVLQHFGAANGMSAVVGGDGPPDSKYLSIRVSPAELINVTTPAQREAERYNKDWGKRIIQNFNISVKGDAGMGDRRTRRQVLEGIGNAAASSRTTH